MSPRHSTPWMKQLIPYFFFTHEKKKKKTLPVGW